MRLVLFALYLFAGVGFMVYCDLPQKRWQFDGEPSPLGRVLVITLWPLVLISLLAESLG